MAENQIPQGSNNAGNVLGWLEKLSGLIQKSGLHNLFLTIMMLFLVIIVGYCAFNPGSMIKKIEEVQSKQHTEAVMKRLKSEPRIRENLVNLKMETGADRVFILETHNGGSNLAGLPFLYVDLTYAEPQRLLTWMESEYRNVRLSRYPWATKMYQDTFWYGPIDDIMAIDPELYYRLQKEDVKYMGMMIMYGVYNPSGAIGIVYTSETKDENIPSVFDIERIMLKYDGIFSVLFNNEQ